MVVVVVLTSPRSHLRISIPSSGSCSSTSRRTSSPRPTSARAIIRKTSAYERRLHLHTPHVEYSHTHTHTPSTYTIVRCDGIGDLSSQAIQANKPMMRRCRVAYFEVELLSTSQPSAASVGISDRHFSLCRHPGWEPKYAPMARTLTLRLSGVRVLNHAATARMDTTAATATSSPAVEANHSDPSSSRAT